MHCLSHSIVVFNTRIVLSWNKISCCFHFIWWNDHYKVLHRSWHLGYGHSDGSWLVKLERLERLHSEDTPRHLMITHSIESYWIPSQKKTSESYKFKEFAKISNFLILKQTLHATHLLKSLNKMCKYEMDPTSIVEKIQSIILSTDGQGENQHTPLSTPSHLKFDRSSSVKWAPVEKAYWWLNTRL